MPLPTVGSPRPTAIQGIPVHQNRYAALAMEEDGAPAPAARARTVDSKAGSADLPVQTPDAPIQTTPINSPIDNNWSTFSHATSFFLDEADFPSDLPRDLIEDLREVEVIFNRERTQQSEPWRYRDGDVKTWSGIYQSPLIAADAFRNSFDATFDFGPVHVDELGNVSRREPWSCSPEVGLCVIGPPKNISPAIDRSRAHVVTYCGTMFAPALSAAKLPVGLWDFAAGVGVGVLVGASIVGVGCYVWSQCKAEGDEADADLHGQEVNHDDQIEGQVDAGGAAHPDDAELGDGDLPDPLAAEPVVVHIALAPNAPIAGGDVELAPLQPKQPSQVQAPGQGSINGSTGSFG